MRQTFCLLVVAAGVAACAGDSIGTTSGSSAELPTVLAKIVAERPAPAIDTFEVWVCAVPVGIGDPLYDPSSDRVALTPAGVVGRIAGPVATYFGEISHGAYRAEFVAGGTVHISTNDTSQQCIDAAVAASAADIDAVLVVADAQHAADQPGGRSTPGSWLTCTDGCSAAATGRSVYVGANDFHADLAERMPFDLIQHELGHSLGLPHSGDVGGAAGNRGVGPYDVMADPASPRAADAARRDAPDTLAIDRLDLGWLPIDAARIVVSGDGATTDDGIELSPSTGTDGVRVAIVALDEHRLLTVELLTDSGYNDHLPRPGVVVHMVGDSPEQCGATTRCTDLQRVQQIVGNDADGGTLLVAGDVITFGGWRVIVDDVSRVSARVRVARVASAHDGE